MSLFECSPHSWVPSAWPTLIWGFLKHLDEERFPDGQRQLLSDDQLGMCFFFLLCGFYPNLKKVRDLRAGTRGELILGLQISGTEMTISL